MIPDDLAMITPDAYARDERPNEWDHVFEKSPALRKQEGHDEWRNQFNACNWVKPLLDPASRRKMIAYAALRIRDKMATNPIVGRSRALAFTGLSGSLIAGPLATELECHLYAVRKAGESRHSSQEVEGLGMNHAVDYIIVDDFVGSGRTVQRIAEQVYTHTCGAARCVAIYCWRDDCFYTGAFLSGVLADEERRRERGGSLV